MWEGLSRDRVRLRCLSGNYPQPLWGICVCASGHPILS
nr:MAG TPA: hypothetical protein [Bacteriophage sp.]